MSLPMKTARAAQSSKGAVARASGAVNVRCYGPAAPVVTAPSHRAVRAMVRLYVKESLVSADSFKFLQGFVPLLTEHKLLRCDAVHTPITVLLIRSLSLPVIYDQTILNAEKLCIVRCLVHCVNYSAWTVMLTLKRARNITE